MSIPLFALAALIIGSVGEAVRRLHTLLRTLGIGEIPNDESDNAKYGPGTVEAVKRLQSQYELTPPRPGEVDAATAEAVNRSLYANGKFYRIYGRVTDQNGQPVAGVTIRVTDADNIGGAYCAETSTGGEGEYRAYYDPSYYTGPWQDVITRKEFVEPVVSVIENGVELERSSRSEPGHNLQVNLQVERRVTPPEDTGLRVRGNVVDDRGGALSSVRVEVFDRDIGDIRELLGDATTGQAGDFEIRYATENFTAGDPARPLPATADLIFKLSKDGAEITKFDIVRLPVGRDGPITVEFAVPEEDKILGIVGRADELVRIVARGVRAPRGQSEYERLIDELKPLTGRRPLAQFDEAGTRDVTFAAREIGEPVAFVADLVWAHQMTAAGFSASPTETLYGLARQIGTRDIRALAARSVSELAAGLGNAVAALIIPEIGDDVLGTATTIHDTAVGLALGVAPAGASGSAGSVLADVLPEETEREALFAKAANSTGTGKEFWDAYHAGNPNVPVDALQYTLQLGALTSNNARLVAAMKQAAPQAKSLRALAFALDREKIEQLVTASGGVPSRGGSTDPDLARADYVGEINGLLESAHPTAVVARLARGWSEADPAAVSASAAKMLSAAVLKTDFDITHGDVDELVAAHGDVLFVGINDPDERMAATESVKRVHRLFNVSADPSILEHLVFKRVNGTVPLRGAIDIARYGKDAFIANFPGVSEVEMQTLSYVHDRARAVADTVANLIVAQHQDHRDAIPAAAAGPLTALSEELPADGAGSGETLPDGAAPADVPIAAWSDLFGGAEMCDCDDCRSVIGPAAYLVDLFEFLDKRCSPDPATLVTPLDVLIGHPTKSLQPGGPPGIRGMRPDLAHIKLTCENTNTTIPTIDLINEILESVVASGDHTPELPNESSPGITGAELSAAPEHVVEAAYTTVGNAAYPISLPYDRLMATARVYLRQAGTSRADLMRLLCDAPAQERDGALVAETLGLFRRDYEILTFKTLAGAPLAAPIAVADLYGFPGSADTSWMELAAVSRRLLAAFELTFVELLTLIRTRFVGGEVPSGNSSELGSRIFLTVDQLKALREADYAVEPDSEIERALMVGGLTTADIRGYIEARLPRLETTIVFDPPIGCSPDVITLRHLDASHLTSEEDWLAMHRFVRLARRMKIGLGDLDAALYALSGGARAKFTPELLSGLAALRDLKDRFDLDWPVAASLVGDIGTYGSESLYDTLFPPKGLARVNPEFQRDKDGVVFKADRDIAAGLPGMAAAFGVDADTLRDLAERLEVKKLNLAGLSAIHRVIVLSRVLGISPQETVRLSKSSGAPELVAATIAPGDLANWASKVENFASAELSAAAICYLTGRESGSTGGAGTSQEALDEILANLATQLQTLAEQEARERAEEAERKEAENPFTDAELKARRTAAEQRRRAAVLAHFASSFGLDPDIVARLLDDTKAGEASRPALLRYDDKPAVELFARELDTATLQTAASRLLTGIDRLALLTKAAKLEPGTLAIAAGDGAIVTSDAIKGLMDEPSGKTVATMLADLSLFMGLLRDTGRPAAMAAAVSQLAQGGWQEASFAAIGSWLGRPTDMVKAVPRAGVLKLVEATAKQHPVAALAALRERLTVLRRVGMDAADAVKLTREPIESGTLDKLVQGVASGYSRTDWLDVSRQLSDPIREESRDALTAFLLRRESLQSAEQLFDRFYIDVGTNAFVLTSRIRQAIFAVQIFIQRCLMGFERIHGVSPGQIDVEEWKTISRQAVWAARGKALLYPEELLNPAWRDNKSPAFKAFEAALQQGDITPANAEVAYRAYLDEFQTVASLEVCGTYLQEMFEGREAQYVRSVLHVVGRTRGGAARKYFYRRLNRYERYEEWTSWEPVDVDIQAIEPDRQEAVSTNSEPLREAGVHLLPVVWRGQVYLFWPTFTRKVDQLASEPVIKEGDKARFSLPYWEIKLCWTRKDGASWTPKEQSSALFETWWYYPDEQPEEWDWDGIPWYGGYAGTSAPQYPDPNKFVLKANNQVDSLAIVVSTRQGAWGPKPRGTFRFSRAASEMSFYRDGGGPYGDHFRAIGSSSPATPSFMGFKARGKVSFVATAKSPEGDVFFNTTADARFTTLNQFYAAPFKAPLFIDLADRSYFAQSSPGVSIIFEKVEKPESKPEWQLGIEYDPNGVVALDPKVKEVNNPWVKAAVANNVTYLASVTESAQVFSPKFGAAAVLDPGFSVSQVAGAVKPKPDYGIYVGPTFKAVNVPGLNLDVKPFFHPFADKFTEVLRRDGLVALLTPEMQRGTLAANDTFADLAKPNPERVTTPAVEGMDFEQSTPYGNYNWELFFHAPVMLAQKLFDNAQYEAAIDLIRSAVYTPFATNPEECWRFEGLRGIAPTRLDDMLAVLSRPDSDPEKQNVLAQIDTMRLFPFQAHRIARLRPLAYKKWVVAFDVRLHLALGDRFFRRFTPEDVNQAIQYYVIAYREMGKKPEVVPQRATMPARSYAELRPDLDAMGNVMFAAESKLAPASSGAGGADGSATGIMQRGSIGYFGIPKNEKLLALWDDVADRLFKIRNGMNIEGVQMQLPLFSPPIDPALLAEAVASGIDIGAVLEQLAQPLPKQRYAVMCRRAMEHAEAVVRLGDLLLAAREKRDSEDLARTRAKHAKEMSDLIGKTRERELEEAQAELDSVIHEEDAGRQRWMHFAELLGELPQWSIAFVPYQTLPARKLTLVDADKISFESLRVVSDIAKIGSFLLAGLPGLAVTIADETAGGIRQLAAGKVLQEEQQELESAFDAVKTIFDSATLDTLAALLGVIPNFEAAVKPLGAGAAVHLGGQFFASAATAKARNKRAAADVKNFVASVYRKQADIILRERGWVLEMNEAALAVQQARRRKSVADIRVDVAQKAVDNQKKDLEQAELVETFLQEKFTNVELYDWTELRLRQLFKQCCTLALESARMAEACYTFEREKPAKSFIQMGMPTDARAELLAGHELMACLRDMDRAYISAPRTGELTRHISLRQIDPYALNQLREKGDATFKVPEVLFDIDHPGYYDRRIKSIQVTIPCVAGPYAPVTGTLTLVASGRRKKPKLGTEPEPDPQGGASIALSSSRSDSGLFELSSQDPLYLPFEGMGAISTWTLTLPQVVKNFDYWSIADVVLTMQYTAKRGSDGFGNDVSTALKNALNDLTAADGKKGIYQLVSMRHELPDLWYRFKAGEGLSVELTTEILPFMLRSLDPSLVEVAGKIRMAGNDVKALAFKPPAGASPLWTLETLSELPAATKVEDITLFANFKL